MDTPGSQLPLESALLPPVRGQAPPTRPAPLPPAPPAWPTAIGVVSIVLGACGVVMHGCSALGNLFMLGFFTDMFGETPEGRGIAAMGGYTVPLAVVGLAVTATSAVLIIAGVLLLQRRRLGARLHTPWAVGKVVAAVALCVLTYFAQKVQLEAMAAAQATGRGAGGTPVMMGMMGAVQTMMLGVMFLWYSAYPVFVVIWFRRAAVRAQVAGWAR